MKKIICGMFLTLSFSAFALPSETIYNYLSAKEVDVTPKSWVSTRLLQKSIGGLVCTEKTYIDFEYSCQLNIDNYSLEVIYGSLRVSEVKISETEYEKRAGTFAIRRNITGRDTYSLAVN